MRAFVLARLALVIPVLFGVSLVTFSLIRLVPGDPVTVVLGPDARTTPEQVAAIRTAFGLDEPAPVQYLRWMGHILSGDLGTSFRTGRSLTAELALRLPVTIELTVLAAVLGLIPALGVGTLAAIKRNSKTDYVACPSCGRTLFDLQETTERIKSKTSHLVGVRLAIMGCIVNGPGEMADADFGYVGGAPGQVNLYVGKECVEKGVPAGHADDRLVELIKSRGKWQDPEEGESDGATVSV